MQLTGIHHLTAVTARVRENYRFYTGTLGLRLVKRSVNQDDVSAYHLFYADSVGTPGTDLTFFDWRVPGERRGNHTIIRTHLRVSANSLAWWGERLDDVGVAHSPVTQRGGSQTMDFEDPEGQRLSLIADDSNGPTFVPWERSPVPVEHQIRGLGPVVMSVPQLAPTDMVLSRALGMRKVEEFEGLAAVGAGSEVEAHRVHVYEMGPGGVAAQLHVAVRPGVPVAVPGAGGVHHVAFRVSDDEEHRAWFEHLNTLGIQNSGIVDRYYFKSLYFREPNGILFEIATDGPGFAVDEDPATLGESVVLPPFLEPQRESIVANLRPIE